VGRVKALDPGPQGGGIGDAGLAGGDLPALEGEQGRNPLHAEATRQAAVGVHIDLDEAGPRFELGGGAGEHRRHGAAGPAPGGPEVDDQRQVAGRQVLGEPRFIERHRFAGEQGLVAAAAARGLAEPFGRQAIGAVAVRTDDVQGLGHGGSRASNYGERRSKARPSD
jgi:hypothetical protein